jgi:hypothetical protein
MKDARVRESERVFYDETDYADVDLQLAEDVKVVRERGPRSTFALRLDGGTIDQLRLVAERVGVRPTQLARRWLVERLNDELRRSDEFVPGTTPGTRDASAAMATISKAIAESVAESVTAAVHDARDAARIVLEELQRALQAASSREFGLISGSWERGVSVLPTGNLDADLATGLIAQLDAQANFARMLIQSLGEDISVEVPPDAGADLMVRRGERSWICQFKSGTQDVIPAFTHLAAAARRLHATPVLVSPLAGSPDLAAITESADALVVSPRDLGTFVREIALAPQRVPSTSSANARTARRTTGTRGSKPSQKTATAKDLRDGRTRRMSKSAATASRAGGGKQK